MSFLKTTLMASTCLYVAVSVAKADELRLSDQQLDHVTAGELAPLPPIPDLSGGFDGTPKLPGLLQPPPPPPPPPASPPASPPPPTIPGSDVFSNLQQLLQQLFNFAGQV